MKKKNLRKLSLLVTLACLPQVGFPSFLDKLQKTLDAAAKASASEGQSGSQDGQSATVSNRPSSSVDPTYLNPENIELSKAGLWRDPYSKLMWTRCPVGSQWNGKYCDGQATHLDWSQAMEAAGKTTINGYSDWRLPTKDELSTLYRCDRATAEKAAERFRGSPVIDPPANSILLPNGCYKPRMAAQTDGGGWAAEYQYEWFNVPIFVFKKIFDYDNILEDNFWTSTVLPGDKVASFIFDDDRRRNDPDKEADFDTRAMVQAKGNPVGVRHFTALLVRDGRVPDEYAAAKQFAQTDAERGRVVAAKYRAKQERDQRAYQDYKQQQREQTQRVVQALDQEEAAYRKKTEEMRRNPHVNDIAKQGRILEVRGNQVRIEVYQEVCVSTNSSGCGQWTRVPNGAQAWIPAASLIVPR